MLSFNHFCQPPTLSRRRIVSFICAAVSITLVTSGTASATNSSEFDLQDIDSIAKTTEAAAESAGINTLFDISLTERPSTITGALPDGSVEIAVPNDEAASVTLSTHQNKESELISTTLLLPETATGNLDLSAADTAVIMPSLEEGNVAYAVNASEEGSVRIQSVIASPEAPESYEYTFPEASRIEIDPADGEAIIWVKSETYGEVITGVAETPWARDAQGRTVPSHFEASGNTLTQIVKHKDGDFTYPITADPKWWDSVKAWFSGATKAVKAKAQSAANWLGSNAKWLKKHVNWHSATKLAGSAGKKVVKSIVPGGLALCAIGSGWAWYRSDAKGWVRAGDALMGCF